MADHRLINCKFVRDMETTNKATLVYLMFINEADDLGFVGNGLKIAKNLQAKEDNIGLAEETYENALFSLVEKGLLFAFNNNYGDTIFLIRHWFLHNHWKKGLWTNYKSLTKKVKLVDNEYVLKTKEEIREEQERWKKPNPQPRTTFQEIDDMDQEEVDDDKLPFEI